MDRAASTSLVPKSELVTAVDRLTPQRITRFRRTIRRVLLIANHALLTGVLRLWTLILALRQYMQRVYNFTAAGIGPGLAAYLAVHRVLPTDSGNCVYLDRDTGRLGAVVFLRGSRANGGNNDRMTTQVARAFRLVCRPWRGSFVVGGSRDLLASGRDG